MDAVSNFLRSDDRIREDIERHALAHPPADAPSYGPPDQMRWRHARAASDLVQSTLRADNPDRLIVAACRALRQPYLETNHPEQAAPWAAKLSPERPDQIAECSLSD